MRARRTPISDKLKAAMQRVVDDALDQRLVDNRNAADARVSNMTAEQQALEREAEGIAAARKGNFRLLADLLEHQLWLGPEAAALVAARLRGEFKARRGDAARKRGMSHFIALQLPFIEQVLRAHFPTERITQELAVELVAKSLDYDDQKLRYHLTSRHRPRRSPRR
jgi:hypothetical protein